MTTHFDISRNNHTDCKDPYMDGYSMYSNLLFSDGHHPGLFP